MAMLTSEYFVEPQGQSDTGPKAHETAVLKMGRMRWTLKPSCPDSSFDLTGQLSGAALDDAGAAVLAAAGAGAAAVDAEVVAAADGGWDAVAASLSSLPQPAIRTTARATAARNPRRCDRVRARSIDISATVELPGGSRQRDPLPARQTPAPPTKVHPPHPIKSKRHHQSRASVSVLCLRMVVGVRSGLLGSGRAAG